MGNRSMDSPGMATCLGKRSLWIYLCFLQFYPRCTPSCFYLADIQFFIGQFLSLPFVASKVEAELSDLRADLSAKVAPKVFPAGINLTTVRTLPEKGRSREWLEEEWKNLKMLERGDVDNGRVSGTVYHVSSQLPSPAWAVD
jgi:hypothetical protein